MELTENPLAAKITEDLDTTSAAPNDNAEAQPEFTPEQTLNIQKMFKLFKRAREGNLTFHDFKSLPAFLRAPYVRKFGVPKTREELRGIEHKIAKRRRATKVASASRRRNRGA